MGDLGDAYADAHLDLDSLDRDIDNATSMLREAVSRWEQLADVSGVISMDTDQATDDVQRAAREWQTIIDRVSGSVAIDTGLASADVDSAAAGWEAAAQVSGNVDMDTSNATAQVQSAASEWEQLVNVTGTVDIDTLGASAQVAAMIGELDVLADPITINLEADTAAVTAQIVAASSAWEAAAQVQANVDVNVSGLESFQALTQVLETLSQQTELFIRFELDNASVATITGEIAAIVATWESMLKLTPEIQSPTVSDAPGPRRRPGRNTPAAANAPPGVDVDVNANTADAYAQIRAAAAEWERLLSVFANIKIDDTALATEAATASGVLSRAIADIKALIDVDPAEAVTLLRGLGPTLEAALGDIETRLGTTGLNEELRLAIAELRFIAGKEIQIPVGLDTTEGYSAAAQFKVLLREIERGIKANIKPGDFSGIVAAEAAIAELRRLSVTVPVDFDADTAGFLTDVEITDQLAERLIGVLHSRLELDGGPAYLAKVTAIKVATSALTSGIGEGINAGVENSGNILTRAGDAVTGILSDLGQNMAKAAGNLPQMAAQVASMIGMAFLWVGVIAPLIASAVVGVGALIGTAAGFVTLAASIGAAAGAAGLLGIALNKDLLARVKDGLDELKTGVAAVTRDAGEQLINKFQTPFINVLTEIAASASKLTSVFVDPIAIAALDWLRTFQSLLDTPAAAEFAAGLGEGIGRLIGTFNEFLPIFLEISNEVGGPLFDSLDAVIRMFLELGVSGKDVFVEFFRVIEVLADVFVDMGEKSLPVIESLLSGLADFLQGDFFGEFVDFLGIAGQLVVKIIKGFSEGFSEVDDAAGTTTRTMNIFLSALSTIADIAPVIGKVFAFVLEGINGAIVVSGTIVVGLYELIAGGAVVVLEYIESLILRAKDLAEVGAALKIPGAEEAAIGLGLAADKIGSTSDDIQSHMGDVAESFNTTVTGLYSNKGGVEDFATSVDGLGLVLEKAADGALTADEAFDLMVEGAQGADSKMGELVRTFQESGKYYGELRAQLEEPIKLKIEYPDIKQIADDIGSQVKIETKTIPAVPEGTEGGGGGGSDLTGNGAIADALNQTQQEATLPEIPAQEVEVLSKSYAQAIAETLKEAQTAVDASNYAELLESQGNDGLAAMVRGITDPRLLDQAKKEFGEWGGELAKEAEKGFDKITALQKEAEGGGLLGTLAQERENNNTALEKGLVLQMLEARKLPGVAKRLAAATGDELVGMLKEIREGGDEFLLMAENTINMNAADFKAGIEASDPLAGMRDYAETISKNSGTAAAEAAARAARGLAGGKGGTKPRSAADEIAESLDEGIDPEVSKNVAETIVKSVVGQMQAAVVAAQPQIGASGALLNTYFSLGINSGFEETRTAPFGTAVVARALIQFVTAVDAVRPATTVTGGVMVANFAAGITLSTPEALKAATGLVTATSGQFIVASLISNPLLRGVGRSMAQAVVDGINEVTESTAAATGAGFINELVSGLSGAGSGDETGIAGIGERAVNGARKAAEQAVNGKKEKDVGPGVAIGMAIGDGILAGIALRVPVIVAAVQALGNLIALTMKASLKIKSPSQVTQSIGEQVADGLALGIGEGQARAVASAQAMTDAVRGTLEDGIGRMTVLPELVADDTAAALEGISRGVADRSPVLTRPEVNLPESARLVGVQTISVADPAGRGVPNDTVTPASTPSDTSKPGPTFQIAKLEVNGVRDAENVPDAIIDVTDTESWRLGFGESPRRRI